MDFENYSLGKDYVIDEKFNEFVKNKTIAFVGPAPNIIGKGYGEFIDSHDLVFRIGDSPVGFCGKTGLESDYGSRSDVLVHRFNEHDRPELLKDIKWLSSLKWILASMLWLQSENQIKKMFSICNVPYTHVPDDTIQGLRNHLDSLPNTGFVGLLCLLNYDIKSIFMTGITFYNMGDWSQSNNYFPNWYQSEKYKIHGLNERHDLHKPMHDIWHFQKLLKLEKYRSKIQFDEYLLKHFSK